MRCTYLSEKKCLAVPADDHRLQYEPTAEDKKEYCESSSFRNCPRLESFVEYLQSMSAAKRK